MSYAGSLQALSDADLRILLSRRPEVAEVTSVARPAWKDLATALLRPRAVARAVARLDRFLGQVLQLACLEGGRLTPSVAAEEGLARVDLERAACELRRWGLAAGDGDGGLAVPPVVLSMAWDPGGLGMPAALLLDHLTAEELRQIALRHGVRGPALPKRKHDLAEALRVRLADREAIRALVGSAPPAAREALDALRRAGGTTRGGRAGRPWSEQAYYSWATYGYMRDHRDARDGAGWLMDHGLVLPEDLDQMSVGVPSEVERALRGRVFARWDVSPPALDLAPLHEETHPADLITAMDTLLEAWRHAPPTALKDGGVPKREIKRAGQRIGRSEDEAKLIVLVAEAAGLLRVREVVPEKRSRSWRQPRVLESRRAVIEPSDDAERWLGLPEARRWLELASVWLSAFAPGADGHAAGAPSPARLVLDLLGEIADGQGASAASLGAVLSWRHPAFFADAASAGAIADAVGRGLASLGAGTAAPVVGLSAIGRLTLIPGGAVDGEAVERAFPASAERCVVTADHRVVVSGPPGGDLARVLRVVAEVESVRPARVYRITAVSLGRALDGGLTGGAILDTLRAHASEAVPSTVTAFIEDTARRHGRVRVGTAEVYVVTDDPAQLEEVARERGVAGEGLRRISPTVAVIDGRTVGEVMTALRRAGLMPVADGVPPPSAARAGSAATGGPEMPRGSAAPPAATDAAVRAVSRPDPSPRPAEPAALDDAAAARLIATLRSSPAFGDGLLPALRPPEDELREALAAAVHGRQRVELGYRGASGRLDVLTVLPYNLLREQVWVQDAVRFGVYKLDLHRIAWAETVH